MSHRANIAQNIQDTGFEHNIVMQYMLIMQCEDCQLFTLQGLQNHFTRVYHSKNWVECSCAIRSSLQACTMHVGSHLPWVMGWVRKCERAAETLRGTGVMECNHH